MAKMGTMLEERSENWEDQLIDYESQIGDQFSDFEILEILSKVKDNMNKENFVAKVRSLKNDKIYAMRKSSLEKIRKKSIRDNCLDELNKLTELNHPNIIKYYKYFTDEKQNVYLIMEYMNNGDVGNLINIHRELNEPIKEEQIWIILLQCASALKYLDSNNDFHFGIRFNAIFFNNENKVKISIYNESPKEDKDFYDIKDDIYELGFHIYALCVDLEESRFINSIKEISYEENNKKYSADLTGFIYNKMRNIRKSLRPYAFELYNLVKSEYSKKYSIYTSIDSVIRCLHTYTNLNKDIFEKEKEIIDNKENNLVSFYFLTALKSISGINESFYNDCLLEFKHAVYCENCNLSGNKSDGEIDPIYFLAFLLEELHKELNQKKLGNQNKENDENKFVINSKFNGVEEEDKQNKMKVLENFVKSITESNKSPIYNLFYGIIKTKTVCQTCRLGKYSFSDFSFVVFDVSKNEKNYDFDIIEDGFKKEYIYPKWLKAGGPDQVYCEKCMGYQDHCEFDFYYMMNNQLIICFYTGDNQVNIKVEKSLDLNKYVEDINSPKKYYLVGSIIKVKEKFTYFARDNDDKNLWISEKENIKDSNIINEIKKEGQIVMLFYNNKNLENNK